MIYSVFWKSVFFPVAKLPDKERTRKLSKTYKKNFEGTLSTSFQFYFFYKTSHFLKFLIFSNFFQIWGFLVCGISQRRIQSLFKPKIKSPIFNLILFVFAYVFYNTRPLWVSYLSLLWVILCTNRNIGKLLMR